MSDTTAKRDWFTEYYAALEWLDGQEYRRREVETLAAQATSYVWGWQDGSPDNREPGDSKYSLDFGYAYGIYAAEYAAGKRGSRMPIVDAWRSFREHSEIRSLY